jgi:predicted transcriptional regulator
MKKLKGGWVEGSVQEFLKLSDSDMAYIETKRALAACLRRHRIKNHLTQVQFAARLQTSQSRLAKMEAGDRTVTIDLLIQALFRIGASRQQVAAALTHASRPAA